MTGAERGADGGHGGHGPARLAGWSASTGGGWFSTRWPTATSMRKRCSRC